ncbi:MAG: TMEM175 family protein [Candidatus Sphingomonas phytovorans]|nr:TMEM175 family protein [Sphingomonas sp.]WEJ97996.1 MAG: TMEM175 family protein [Sphingomonas sp.]
MATKHSGKHSGPEHALERLVFFSDAVFAIAITLLVIEIHVPRLPPGSTNQDYFVALAHLIPSFFGFFVSFWVIGAFWIVHHRAFSLAAHYRDSLLTPNLAVLCGIVFIPFATAFMAANTGMLVPQALYDLTLIVCGLLHLRLNRMVTSPPVVSEQADPLTIALTRVRGWSVTLGAACALAIGFVDSHYSQVALITIPLWRILLQRRTRRRFPAA